MANQQTAFYNCLKQKFGINIMCDYKNFSNNNRKISNNIAHRNFLLECRRSGIFPCHIKNTFNCVYQRFKENSPFVNKANRLIITWKKQLLNLEISDTIRTINVLSHENESLKHTISTSTPDETHQIFFSLQKDYYYKNLEERRREHRHKLMALKGVMLPTININFNEKWLVNLTNVELPTEFKLLISLGEKFSINRDVPHVPFFHLIADVENALKTIEDENAQCAARSDIATMIKNYVINGGRLNNIDKFTNEILDKSLKFIKRYESRENAKKIVVMRSDKGQQSVVIYKDDYDKGMNTLLNDRNNYKIAEKGDPTLKVADKNNKFVKKLFDQGIIDKMAKSKMCVNNATPPKIYGLVKTHKPNISASNIILRPVVSYIGSPLYNLAGYLGKIISKSLSNKHPVKNSYEFHNSIKNQRVPPGYKLASFDVVSLFTCIPQSFLLECIDLRWESISQHTNMDAPTFKEAVKLCLENSYFVYNGVAYYQISGSPMGSPISSALANLAMEIMLEKITNLLPFDLPFLFIFVDDILTAIPENIVEETLEMFNAVNTKIQFTMELESDRQIPYLDLKLTRENDGTISTEFYQKPCASGRILNFYSNHSTALKINTAIGLIKRIYTFSASKCETVKHQIAVDILRKNNFPKTLIHKLICEYKNKDLSPPINHPEASPSTTTTTATTTTITTAIRYVRGLTENICRKIKAHNEKLKISTPPERSLRCFFSKQKDKTPDGKLSKLIYMIRCLFCPKLYFGMTWKQYFDTRLLQHERQQNRTLRGETFNNKTAITDHISKEQHRFNFSQAQIIDRSHNYQSLKTLEMLHISSNQDSCNFRSDVSNTIQQYQSLIATLKSRNLI